MSAWRKCNVIFFIISNLTYYPKYDNPKHNNKLFETFQLKANQ
jgi:hypothetical protein